MVAGPLVGVDIELVEEVDCADELKVSEDGDEFMGDEVASDGVSKVEDSGISIVDGNDDEGISAEVVVDAGTSDQDSIIEEISVNGVEEGVGGREAVVEVVQEGTIGD